MRRFVAPAALVWTLLAAGVANAAPAPCADAFQYGVVCAKAFQEAARLFGERHVQGAYVIEDVESGAVVSHGALISPDDPGALTVTSSILPLSVSKLFLAASLWTHHDADLSVWPSTFDQQVIEMLLHSDDAEGRRLAGELPTAAGTDAVLADLAQYGMPACDAVPSTAKDKSFWGTPGVPDYLVPARACMTLDAKTGETEWDNAFSLGEANFSVTLLYLTRFIQAIGSDGMMIAPDVREDSPNNRGRRETAARTRMVSPAVAALIRRALVEAVERGTARKVKARIRGGWQLAGKTGSSGIHGEPFDGIFVGLVSDPSGKARYAFAIYVEKGGLGGGAAAEIICDIFNYALGL